MFDTDETSISGNGAKQSKTLTRLDLVPPDALRLVGSVLNHGANKYGVENWRGLSVEDNLAHSLQHIYAFLASRNPTMHGYQTLGDVQELSHAATRLLFALELAYKAEQEQQAQDESDSLVKEAQDKETAKDWYAFEAQPNKSLEDWVVKVNALADEFFNIRKGLDLGSAHTTISFIQAILEGSDEERFTKALDIVRKNIVAVKSIAVSDNLEKNYKIAKLIDLLNRMAGILYTLSTPEPAPKPLS